MGQQIASKIATVLKKAIHVKMTHRAAECVIAFSLKRLLQHTLALSTTKTMDPPTKHVWKIVAQKSAYHHLQSSPLKM